MPLTCIYNIGVANLWLQLPRFDIGLRTIERSVNPWVSFHYFKSMGSQSMGDPIDSRSSFRESRSRLQATRLRNLPGIDELVAWLLATGIDPQSIFNLINYR